MNWNKTKKTIENIIFSSQRLLIPFYFGLFVALIIYTIVYLHEIYNFVSTFQSMNREDVLLATLGLVDIVMIANLVKMIITGSYHSFVDKEHGFKWENANSGMLKVKIATSLIWVSSIHLLQSFINAHNISWEDLQKQLIIHWVFLTGSLLLALINYVEFKTGNHH